MKHYIINEMANANSVYYLTHKHTHKSLNQADFGIRFLFPFPSAIFAVPPLKHVLQHS
jgi:hypothetical protein